VYQNVYIRIIKCREISDFNQCNDVSLHPLSMIHNLLPSILETMETPNTIYYVF